MKKGIIIVIALIILFSAYNNICYGQGQSSGTLWVYRRQIQDIYFLIGSDSKDTGHIICERKYTYIVDNRNCSKNEDIFKQCRFALGENDNLTPRLYALMNEKDPVWMVTNLESRELVNTSLCQVVSLNVYRGKENVIEISHSGFTLTDRGTIEINKHQLAYDHSEYEGELFQLKLSCIMEGKSQDECLFFKVYGMSTNLTEPKFNCTVPGTLYDHSTGCPTAWKVESTTAVKPKPEATHMPKTTIFSATTVDMAEKKSPMFHIGSPLFYGVVGTGNVIFALLFLCFFCVCGILFCRRKEREERNVSAIVSLAMERKISTISKQIEATNGKDLELHLYEVPGKLMPSNMYGFNCLEVNQAYLETEKCRGKTEIKLLDGNISDNNVDENREPLYQEIVPKLELSTKLPSILKSTTTVENDLYRTSIL